MKLEGKTVNFLGDSITAGTGVTDIENCRYDNIVKNRCKLKEVYNFGIGGTRIAHQGKASEEPCRDMYFCARAYCLNPDADITVVFGGTNDYGHGDAPFGTMDDKTPDTFCGAVDFLMTFLKERQPNAQIIFMTPARRLDDEKPSIRPQKREDARPLKSYVEVIKEKGKRYGIPVLDLYENLGLNPNLAEVRERYAPDGLHFNDEGHKVIADRLIEFISALD